MRRTLSLLPIFLLLLMLLSPADAQAQYYRPYRSRVFVGVGFGVGPYYPYYPFYYRPFYGPFYSPFYYGAFGPYGPVAPWYGGYPYGFYGGYGYGGQGYPVYGPYYYDDTSSARIQVKPRNAEVFIDGYFVGLVDDFDGWLQRLHVMRGEHEVTIYLAGYRTFRQKVLFRPGATVKIEAELQPLASGEAPEPRPTPIEGAGSPHYQRPGPAAGGRPVPAPRRGRESSDYGAISIRVQPVDAEVFVDGERWEVPEGSERIVIQLAEGEHRIEVRREGYRAYSTTVRVPKDDTVPLNVSLTRQ